MQEFGFFLGRFHVLALHLPIGIVIAAVVLDWLARRPRYAALASAAPLLWGLAAVSAVLTAVLGYLHFGEGGFTGPSAEAHRLWGTVTAVAAVAGWWLASRSGGRAGAVRLAAGIAMLALVSITGHYGGNLTHGTTFLGEYAPSFLRGLIGAAPRRPPVDERGRRRPVSRRRAAVARAALRHVPQRRQARTAASASAATTRRSSAATRAARSCPATSKRASSSTAQACRPTTKRSCRPRARRR